MARIPQSNVQSIAKISRGQSYVEKLAVAVSEDNILRLADKLSERGRLDSDCKGTQAEHQYQCTSLKQVDSEIECE